MSLLSRAENFVDSVIDSISNKVNDYHLKKEYKRLEEEGYKTFYVCNVNTIQTYEKVFLYEYDTAQVVWRGSNKHYLHFLKVIWEKLEKN